MSLHHPAKNEAYFSRWYGDIFCVKWESYGLFMSYFIRTSTVTNYQNQLTLVSIATYFRVDIFGDTVYF